MGQPVSRLSQRCQTLASWSQRNHSEALYSVVKSLLQPHWLKSNGVAKGLQKVRAAAIQKFYHRLSAVDLSLAPATIKILGQSAARSRNLLQAHRLDNYRSLSVARSLNHPSNACACIDHGVLQKGRNVHHGCRQACKLLSRNIICKNYTAWKVVD